MTAPTQLTCDYASLVNDVAFHTFGLRAATTDVITESVASTNQAADILRCISKALQYVYSAHRWSFMRPLVSVTTYPAYTTGTITVNSAGVVTGSGTTFPAYSASAGGWLYIPSIGTYAVATYSSGVSLTLTGFPSASAFTTGSTYSLGFNSYPMPTGVDSLEGKLTYPRGSAWPMEPLTRVSEVDIRQKLVYDVTAGRPTMYAITTYTASPTDGSSRFLTFHPTPDDSYSFSAVGTLRPTMIDSTNKYPLGIEILAPAIQDACLAMAERDIEGRVNSEHWLALVGNPATPQAPGSLQLAIQRDKEYSTAESLGVDPGFEGGTGGGSQGTSQIYFDNFAGITGYV